VKYRGIIDATASRLLMPLRAAADAASGALWLNGASVYVRGNDLAKTLLRLLTSADINAPNGVAGLDAMGKIGVDQLPPEVVTTAGGGTGGASGGSTGLVGEIRMWGGDPFQLDNGWLVADGPELSQAAFPALFQRYGHRWGIPSDYATKFRGPNLVNRVPIGVTGANNAASGKIHKINILRPGSGFNASTTTLVTLASTGGQLTAAATANVTTDADGAVIRIDVVTGGTVVGISATPTTVGAGASNCEVYIPQAFGTGDGQFAYEITVVPTASALQGWGVRMTNRGTGYTTPPTVTFNAGCPATGVAILEGSQVREVIITNPGAGTG
jgi:microcystin-dependent protein